MDGLPAFRFSGCATQEERMTKLLRIAFAAVSLFLAFGLFISAGRDPGHASGLLFMAAMFATNGFLHWTARSAGHRVAPE